MVRTMKSIKPSILSLAVILLLTGAAAYASAGGGATIVGITGEVEYSVDGGATWTEAGVKQQLPPGASVRTGAGSGAALLLAGGATMKLNEDSTFSVSDGPGGSAGELEEGDLWALMETGGEEITVNTPSAVVAVRGTEFALSVDSGRSSTLTVVEGNTTFSNQHGSVRVGSSQQSTAAPGSAPSPPKVVDPKNWIEWTLDIRAMGGAVEFRFNNAPNGELAGRRGELESSTRAGDYAARLELARIYHDLGEYGYAEDEFISCMENEDTLWDAVFGLGMTLLSQGDVEGAMAEFDDMQWSVGKYLDDMMAIEKEKRRRYIEEQQRLQQELVMSGRTISGKKGIKQRKPKVYLEPVDEDSLPPIVVDTPETDGARANAHLGMGLALLRRNDAKKAAAEFKSALKLKPGLAMAHTGAAEAAIRQGDLKEASGHLDRALELDPENHQALIRVAAVRLAANRLDEALEYALEAVGSAPAKAAALGVLARVRFYRMEYERARTAAQKAVESDPYSPAAREVLARILIMEEKYRQAAAEALTSLALDENNPFANDDLAMIYYLYRKYDGAIRRWKKAIEAAPNYSAAKVHLARLYNDLEETQKAVEAEKLARDVIKSETRNADAYSELGRALEIQRKYEDAKTAYEKALDIEPKHAKTLGRTASFYVHRHRMDLALEFAIRAVTVQPDNPENHFILGRAYEAVDNLDGAESAYLDALALDPEYELARYQLGIVYTGQGKTYEALHEMHTAALLKPRIVTLAEYRGASRIYATKGSNDRRNIEGVHTGDARDYRYNYRFVLTDRETDGHRRINGWSESTGGSALVGYQKNLDSSLTLYADFTRESEGRPGPDTGGRANDPDDYSNFRAARIDLSCMKRYTPDFSLTFRGGNSRNNSFEIDSNNDSFMQETYEDDFKNRIDEFEIRGDVQYNDRTSFVFGGFQADSEPELRTVYRYYDFFDEDFKSVYDYDNETYTQRNAYAEINYRSGHRVDYMAGAENVFHDYLGSEVMKKYGIDYRIDSRSRLRYINKQSYKLSFTSRYQPREGWMYRHGTDMAGTAGAESRQRELNYETRLPRGDFLKISAFDIKNWLHSVSGGVESVTAIQETSGLRAEYERLLSRKANIFVAVANKRTRDATTGSATFGNLVPYERRSQYTAGLYYFPSSDTTLKIIYDRYGKGYSDFANIEELDPIQLTRLQLRYDPRIDLSYMLTIYNLFDREHEFTKDYPEDNRSYDLSVIHWF